MNLNADRPASRTGFFWNWYVFHDPFTFVAFWTYFTCATASCKRAPFDLAEAESELVAGFHTEYSGLRWSFFFMAEYGSMFAVSGIAVAAVPRRLAHRPAVRPVATLTERRSAWWLGNVINVVVFILKGWLLVFVMMWVRWTLPRLRIDQVMMTCLKYLLPISCVLLLGVSLWQLVVPTVADGLHRSTSLAALRGRSLADCVLSRQSQPRQMPPGIRRPGHAEQAATCRAGLPAQPASPTRTPAC